MAKKYRPKAQGHDAGLVITTNSPYGSHEDMVVDPFDPEELDPDARFAKLNDNDVICQDDRGYYKTERSRLDNGLADPNRYDINRL